MGVIKTSENGKNMISQTAKKIYEFFPTFLARKKGNLERNLLSNVITASSTDTQMYHKTEDYYNLQS
jgi:hypothetical protein